MKKHSKRSDDKTSNASGLAPALVDLVAVGNLKRDTNTEAVKMFFEAFIAELKSLLQTIEHFNINDREHVSSLREIAHTCKSSAGYCGANQVQQEMKKLEQACANEDLAMVHRQLTVIPELITNTIQYLLTINLDDIH